MNVWGEISQISPDFKLLPQRRREQRCYGLSRSE